LTPGATAHMTHQREYFISLRPCPGQQVTACNGGELQVKGIGDILVQGSAGEMPKPLLIRNVLLAPGLTNNLLSGVFITEAGLEECLHKRGLDFCDRSTGELCLRTHNRGKMPIVTLWPAGTEPGRFGYNDERLIEACVAEGILPTTHMRATPAWDVHHCYGEVRKSPVICSPDSLMQMQ